MGSTGAESNDKTLFRKTLHVEDLNNWPSPIDGQLNDLLVDLLGVGRCLLQETVVGNDLETSLLGVGVLRLLLEEALIDEVASQRRFARGAVADDGGRAEGLDTVLGLALVVKVLGLEALLIPGATNTGPTGLAGVDVDGMVVGLHVETNLLLLVLADRGSHLGGVQRGDLVGDGVGDFDLEVDVINAELFVEPVDLLIDDGLGHPTTLLDDLLDCSGTRSV